MNSSVVRTLLRNPVHSLVSAFNQVSLRLSRWTSQSYQLALPFATYAPWLSDPEFLELYDGVQGECLVNLYQCWELWTLGRQKARLAGDFIEVGVWKGGSSVILGRAMQAGGSTGRLLCCDSFEGLVKLSSHDPHNTVGELADAAPGDVEKKMRAFGVSNFEVLSGVFPDQTGDQVSERRFALCHIDVDTRHSASDVFWWVWPRLLNSGVVVFQDYGFHRTPGISGLVDELRGRPDMTVVHNLNGNALVFRCNEQ